jgi:hypothetical protein
MRNSVICFLLVWASARAADAAGQPGSEIALVPRRGPPAEELVKMIAAGRAFPIDVDDASRLESVTGSGSTLVYNYSLKRPPIDPAARQKTR